MLNKKTMYASIAVLALLATVGCSRQRQSNAQPPEPEQIQEYSQERLDEYKGRVVVLTFWESSCVPCGLEMPDLQAVYDEYRDHGVVVLGVNVAEDSAKVIEFAQKHNLTFPMLRDKDRAAAKAFGVVKGGLVTVPQTFLLDQQGQIQYHRIGRIDRQSLAQQLEPLLN